LGKKQSAENESRKKTPAALLSLRDGNRLARLLAREKLLL